MQQGEEGRTALRVVEFGVYLPLRQRRTNTMAPASTAAESASQRRASVAERLSAYKKPSPVNGAFSVLHMGACSSRECTDEEGAGSVRCWEKDRGFLSSGFMGEDRSSVAEEGGSIPLVCLDGCVFPKAGTAGKVRPCALESSVLRKAFLPPPMLKLPMSDRVTCEASIRALASAR